MHLSGVLLQEGGSDFLKGFWSGMGKNQAFDTQRTQNSSIQTFFFVGGGGGGSIFQ